MRIEALASFRRVWPIHAIAVELTGARLRQIAVPALVCSLREFDALELAAALRIEQTQLHLLGVPRPPRAPATLAVPVRAARIGVPRQYAVEYVALRAALRRLPSLNVSGLYRTAAPRDAAVRYMDARY